MIIREEYRYRPDINYKNLRYFKCEDFKTQGCKGVWRIDEHEAIGKLHIEHSVILEHHTFYKEMHEAGTLDIALYNTSYLNPVYETRKRPVLNEETVYILNVLKDSFRTNLKISKRDLIYEVCRNYTVSELWEKYINMTDWLIMEARH